MFTHALVQINQFESINSVEINHLVHHHRLIQFLKSISLSSNTSNQLPFHLVTQSHINSFNLLETMPSRVMVPDDVVPDDAAAALDTVSADGDSDKSVVFEYLMDHLEIYLQKKDKDWTKKTAIAIESFLCTNALQTDDVSPRLHRYPEFRISHNLTPVGWKKIRSQQHEKDEYKHIEAGFSQWHFPTVSDIIDPAGAKQRASASAAIAEVKVAKDNSSLRSIVAGAAAGAVAIAAAPVLIGAAVGIGAAGPIAGGAFAAAQAGLAGGAIQAGGIMAATQGLVMGGAATSTIVAGGVVGGAAAGAAVNKKSGP